MKNKSGKNKANNERGNSARMKTELIWPLFKYDNYNPGHIIEVDSFTFPQISDLMISRNLFLQEREKNRYLGCKKYWDTFRCAKYITIVDKHFSELCLQRIHNELCDIYSKNIFDNFSKDVYICCNNEYDNVCKLYKKIKKDNPNIYNDDNLKICIKFFQPDWHIHDRFTIMDGDIWHCGATIGGMHADLNALSHGWPDVGDKMYNFFREVKNNAYGKSGYSK